jgi:hypothetical protein
MEHMTELLLRGSVMATSVRQILIHIQFEGQIGEWDPLSFWNLLHHLVARTTGLVDFEVHHAMPRSFLFLPLLLASRSTLQWLHFVVPPNGLDVLSMISHFDKLESLFLEFHLPPVESSNPVLPINSPSLRHLTVAIRGMGLGQTRSIRQALWILGRSKFSPGSPSCAGCSFTLDLAVPADALLELNPLFEQHASATIDIALALTLPAGSSLFAAADSVIIDHIPMPDLFQAKRLPKHIKMTFWEQGEDSQTLLAIIHALLASPYHHDLVLHPTQVDHIFIWKPHPDDLDDIILTSNLAELVHPYASRLREKGVEVCDEIGMRWDCDEQLMGVTAAPVNGI